ncbi:universal stress protein family [Halalkalibacter wakoensis JCM 9140]|uniref:Universal stress protein family n=1 Tax=Halalkalibacter wakoensis JCM 9140 TaxID=1236970 RepID=W4Q5Z9_9BACI|nr:universal stress protein [Halalkalibacter wakoensis]GAE27133.1 universal stress protein family [Halalkalibacter wakoensis JCM 9140]
MFNKILLATDGSNDSFYAAERTVELAQANSKVEVHVIHVADHAKAKTSALQYWNSSTKLKRIEKVKPIIELLQKHEIPYQFHYLQGDPGPEIVKFANNHHFDLVMIGSKGKNKLQELVLGSVSHKVAKRVQSPVMIVKSNAKQRTTNPVPFPESQSATK